MSSFSEGQTHQLMNAFERAGFKTADLTELGQFKFLLELKDVLSCGSSKVSPFRYIVDLDADSLVPGGQSVEEHTKGGQFEFNSEKVALYLDEHQQDCLVLFGNELRNKLKDKSVYSANLLEFYLAHPSLIPEEWKGKYVFFWGTIYRSSGGDLCVRCLYWRDGRWDWSCRLLGDDFSGGDPAVVPASLPAEASA